jgi:uncharacterized SAM-binding protein YcdF (DUF218 family)
MLVYNFLLRFCYPAGLCFLLLVGALVWRKRQHIGTICLLLALAVLMVTGNGWIAHGLARSLEWRLLPSGPMPEAQAIVVLSGGILPQEAPRQTVEFDDHGDRVFYAAELFKRGKAPLVVCTGGIVPGSTQETTHADDMFMLLRMLGVPAEAIACEGKSRNTYENAKYTYPLLKDRKVNRILLVTSALHMPRALGVFKRLYSDIEVIPAPTDFGETERKKRPPLLKQMGGIVPSAGNMVLTADVLHEYLGIVYYKLRGWM